LLSSSIDFMRAEAALFGGTGTAKIHMIAGIQNQLLKYDSPQEMQVQI
jgi:DNA replication protein DnaC